MGPVGAPAWGEGVELWSCWPGEPADRSIQMSPRRAHGTKSNQLQRYIPASTPRAAVSDNFRIIVKETQTKEEDTICGPSVPSQLTGL